MDEFYVFLYSKFSDEQVPLQSLAERLAPVCLAPIPCDSPEARALIRGSIDSLPSLLKVSRDGTVTVSGIEGIKAVLAGGPGSQTRPSKSSSKSVMDIAKELEAQRASQFPSQTPSQGSESQMTSRDSVTD